MAPAEPAFLTTKFMPKASTFSASCFNQSTGPPIKTPFPPESALANMSEHLAKASQSGNPGQTSSIYTGYHQSSRVTAS